MAKDVTVPTTLRLSALDRALLDKLVELEAEELRERGVDANISTVVRQLIRQAAKARGIVLEEAPPRPPRAVPRPPKASQDQVRVLLVKQLAKHRGLGAELARRLGVEPSQVSHFKAGTESFPAAKLDALFNLLKHPPKEEP